MFRAGLSGHRILRLLILAKVGPIRILVKVAGLNRAQAGKYAADFSPGKAPQWPRTQELGRFSASGVPIREQPVP